MRVILYFCAVMALGAGAIGGLAAWPAQQLDYNDNVRNWAGSAEYFECMGERSRRRAVGLPYESCDPPPEIPVTTVEYAAPWVIAGSGFAWMMVFIVLAEIYGAVRRIAERSTALEESSNDLR